MSRRSRPQYRSGLGWILGVAFVDTLTRPARLAQGFTCVRCCGSPRASSPHGLTAPAPASHDGEYCVQLPPARGCYHLAPRRTFTSNPVPMPGTPPVGLRPLFDTPAAAFSSSLSRHSHLDCRARKEGRPHGRPAKIATKMQEIRDLARKGLSKAAIAKQLSIGRTSVRRLLGST